MRLFNVVSLFTLMFLNSCGDQLMGHPRNPEFYQKKINARIAPHKVAMEKEKLLYSDAYPMRFALFSDEKFYYEVDELGDGWGKWLMEDGVVKLYAPRPFFEMRLVLSGEGENGEGQILKFRDRSGLQSVKLSVRDPEAAREEGRPLPPLKKFTKSNLGI
jgi:hypothetical protein